MHLNSALTSWWRILCRCKSSALHLSGIAKISASHNDLQVSLILLLVSFYESKCNALKEGARRYKTPVQVRSTYSVNCHPEREYNEQRDLNAAITTHVEPSRSLVSLGMTGLFWCNAPTDSDFSRYLVI